jgi:hypothetical protein
MKSQDSQLVVGLLTVGISWATKTAIESISRRHPNALPSWLDELGAGIVGVLFAFATGRLIARYTGDQKGA